MGGSESKSQSNVLNKILLSSLQKNVSNCASYSDISQNLEFSGSNINIKDMNIKQTFALNQNCVTDQKAISDVKSDFLASLAQEAKKNGVAGFTALDRGKTETYNNMVNEVDLAFSKENISNCVASFNQSQNILFNGKNINAVGLEIEQNITASLNCITKQFSTDGVVNNVATAIDQKTDEVNENLFTPFTDMISSIANGPMGIVYSIFAVIVFIIMVIIFVSIYSGKSDDPYAKISKGYNQSNPQPNEQQYMQPNPQPNVQQYMQPNPQPYEQEFRNSKW